MLARVGCLLGHVSYFEEGADRLLHFHRLQPLGEDAAFEAHPFHDFIALAKPQQPLRFAKRSRQRANWNLPRHSHLPARAGRGRARMAS